MSNCKRLRIGTSGALYNKEERMGKFVIKKTNTGIKFDLKASNGQVVATSQVYKDKAYCVNGIESVRKNAPAANIEDQTVKDFKVEKCPKFEIYSACICRFSHRAWTVRNAGHWWARPRCGPASWHRPGRRRPCSCPQ